MQIDEADRRILRYWLDDPALPRAELAEKAGVTPATLWRRLERLREGGVIKSETAVINWRKLGYEVEVSLRFTLDKTDPRAFDEFIQSARQVPEVLAIETFLGSVDVRLHAIARDMSHWTALYREKILSLPHIAEVEALMLISTIKQTSGLAL